MYLQFILHLFREFLLTRNILIKIIISLPEVSLKFILTEIEAYTIVIKKYTEILDMY